MTTVTKTRRSRKSKLTPAIRAKTREPKAPSIYSGPPIPALRVYRRDVPEFQKCKAECWLLITDTTYTFANTYNDQLKASFDAKHYTYALTDAAKKKVEKKLEADFVEIDVTDWPAWITNAAAAKRTRKARQQ